MFSRQDKVCVYGITGRYGSFHTKRMLEYGTNIVCGVSKNVSVREVHGVPVYNSLRNFVEQHGEVSTAIFFVPSQHIFEAFEDALLAGVEKFVIITEHVPIHDTLEMVRAVRRERKVLIGPNCPGVIYPQERLKIGIMPEKYFKPGEFAIISRSGTLMYEMAKILSEGPGLGLCLGLGGDPIVGTNVAEAFEIVKEHGFEKVLIIGEIGGEDEVRGVEHALKIGFRPENIYAFFAGRHAPEGKRMGHAGAIVEGEKGKVWYKERAMIQMGVKVVRLPWELERMVI
uniref:CoA-binding protein n=1 Tax=Fervidobacterium thailandense TaxID=1008305 RepID=A0A7C4CDY0_9BACT